MHELLGATILPTYRLISQRKESAKEMASDSCRLELLVIQCCLKETKGIYYGLAQTHSIGCQRYVYVM